MAYKTYITNAYVAMNRERIGSDCTLWLFTEAAGMVRARASGIREERSKMRYALQNFSFARISLVRGRNEWRVTGAESINNVFLRTDDRSARARILRATRLLLRCVPGEEPHAELFSFFREGVEYLSERGKDEYAEAVLSLRLLFLLGYVPRESSYLPYLQMPTLHESAEGFRESGMPASRMQSAAESALAASHL